MYRTLHPPPRRPPRLRWRWIKFLLLVKVNVAIISIFLHLPCVNLSVFSEVLLFHEIT